VGEVLAPFCTAEVFFFANIDIRAADAASHLFFAYLRSLAPDTSSLGGVSTLPRSLQALVSQTEYPPQTPLLMQTSTTKVVMIVDSVSPTPFALLRRAKHFEYRDDDEALQQFSAYDDTVKALTDECRRVLERISATNQSVVAPESIDQDASWSRFEDLGFSGFLDSPTSPTTNGTPKNGNLRDLSSLASGARSRNNDFGRPTTPSWADFLSSGFAEDGKASPAPLLLPPDKVLPPIGEAARVHSSQSHMRNGLQTGEDLEPGELASIIRFDLDDTFWWVWITSLADEEPTQRKGVFGRCTIIETKIPGAKWLVVEEQVKGASPGPEEGAYIAEKKGKFSFRTRLGRRKSTGKKPAPSKEPYSRTTSNTPFSKTSIGPDQHARVQAAAAKLAQKQRDEEAAEQAAQRRGRMEDAASTKTNSVLTLQPHLLTDAAAAMKWDKKFGEGALDRDALRAKYLGDFSAGRGSRDGFLTTANGGTSISSQRLSDRELPALPKSEVEAAHSRQDAAPTPDPISSTPPPPAAVYPSKLDSSSAVQIPSKYVPLVAAAMDEKPLTHDQLDTHPAFRKPVAERKPVAAPVSEAAVDQEPASSPELAKTSPPKKLKKNTGGGGFRKMFGRKKTDVSVPVHVPAQTESHIAEDDANTQASATDTGRYTPQPEREHTPPREPSPAYQPVEFEPVRAYSPEVEPSPAVSAVPRHEAPLPAVPITTYDQPEADQTFRRFDQGPMEDMPAFVPDDSGDDDDAASNAPQYQTQAMANTQDIPIVSPVSSRHHEPFPDDMSEESVDLTRQTTVSQDRWAQIRKNAAERAARLSEEQTRRSRSQSARTDEGETSGEETIESRVARIKARVAELTGNVDGQQPPPARRY
jgi:hypothetical protein